MAPPRARTRRTRAALVLGLLGLASACKQAPAAPLVDKFGVEVQGVDWPKGEARKRFSERLFAPGSFRPLAEGATPPRGVPVWNLALSVEVAEPPEGMAVKEAIAVARLDVESDQGLEQEVVTTARARVSGPGLDEWRESTRVAALEAMQKALEGAKVLVATVGKNDTDLLAQLGAADGGPAREWAAAVLADRKNAAALEPLSQMLESDDLMRARWAMRFLIRLGDPRAAGALIEASRHKDDTFQREIVFALGELGGEESEAYLFTVAEGHDLPLMRQSAERALEELRARRSRDGGVRP